MSVLDKLIDMKRAVENATMDIAINVNIKVFSFLIEITQVHRRIRVYRLVLRLEKSYTKRQIL